DGTNAAEFLERALPGGGGRNVVNVILTDFRALATLGEITVLAIAVIGVLSLVQGAADRRPDQGTTPAQRPRPSLIFDTILDGVFRTAIVFSLFLLFAGHNAPGGGFIGGLVAAAALVLRYVAGGVERVDRVVKLPVSAFLGVGLLLATLTGAGGWLWGDAFLASAKVEVAVPLFGTLKMTTALPFDIGVYAVVVGLALAVVRSLGAEADLEETRWY
ncbi:MAG: hydrogen gas-evolving membrane-bound hydrogenase subunit E, partial [Nitriliruptorales bacterium]|nr:hydrogen gas-evolving membrane-bound hydrogenase subunit E [Nitriliruptorales bacterium]